MISLKKYQQYLNIYFVATYGSAWISLKDENRNKSVKEIKKIYAQEYQKVKDEKPSQFDDLFNIS